MDEYNFQKNNHFLKIIRKICYNRLQYNYYNNCIERCVMKISNIVNSRYLGKAIFICL